MGSSRIWDADSDLIRVADDSVLQDIFASGGTISAWVYYTSSVSLARIASKVLTNSGWVFYFETLKLTFFAYFSGDNLKESTGNLSLNTWYYVTATYDSSSASNTPSFYLNGVAEGSSTALTPTGTYDTDVGQDFVIGNTGAVSGGFRGNICYVQAWDRTLSNDEIIESMEKPGSVRQNLVGYWPVLGSDSPERDLSGNGNTGTVTGADSDSRGPPVTNF